MSVSVKRRKILSDTERDLLKFAQRQLKTGRWSFWEFHNALYEIYGV